MRSQSLPGYAFFTMILLLLCLTAVMSAVTANPTPSTTKYKICVPEVSLPLCQELTRNHNVRLTCFAARDRVDCIDKVQQHQADFVPADPEDMYLAAHIPEQHFTVFKEIRTKEEPEEEFRYEAVAVIHKDLNINSVQGLRGLKSCHTGVGRNVGYKIPITKLSKLGVIDPVSDPTLSARENELKALSGLFSQACLVGKWSQDPAINERLKTTYSNLCSLCEDPSKCDYPDKFSGYDGALRCLSDNGGQVAWTKVYYVKKHFGIPIGVQDYTVTTPTRYDPNDYAYLCPDGTQKPILGTPCRWAARPWQGFLANGDLSSNVDDLRQQITVASELGEQSDAAWLTPVLLQLKDKTTTVNAPNPPLAPLDYLNKANYTDVIERGAGAKYHKVRICVMSETEHAKCLSFSRAAFSRDIRPEFDCVVASDLHACLGKVQDDKADIITLDGGEAHVADTQYNLKPIITELYGEHDWLYYAVAVVKKSSTYRTLADLRGARSCHTGYGRTAGWNIPLYTLLSNNLLNNHTCPHAKAVSEFFSGGSCVPGVLSPENNPGADNPTKLCDLCVGNTALKEPQDVLASKCEASPNEDYFGYSGAFHCLAAGAGDVAFVKHTTVNENTDGKNVAEWAAGLRSSDYELLCPDGTRKPVQDYLSCHLAEVPAHVVVTSKSKSNKDIDAIRHAIQAAGDLYSHKPDLFRLFGPYGGKKDLLFKDSATGFRSVDGFTPVHQQYSHILDTLRTCGGN